MSEESLAGAIARSSESGLPMSLRAGQTVEARMLVLEALLEERHRFYTQVSRSQEAATGEQVRASREAIQKAEIATEKRFESVNEFRGQLNDVIKTLMPRTESTGRYQALADKVDQIQTRLDRQEGSSGGIKQGWGLIVGGIVALGAGLTIFASLNKPAPQADDNKARIEAMTRLLEQQQLQRTAPAK